MRSLVGGQEEEVARLLVCPVCLLQAHEDSQDSSVCRTRPLNAHSAPRGRSALGWQGVGLAATLVEFAAQPDSANAAPHP